MSFQVDEQQPAEKTTGVAKKKRFSKRSIQDQEALVQKYFSEHDRESGQMVRAHRINHSPIMFRVNWWEGPKITKSRVYRLSMKDKKPEFTDITV